MANKCYIYLLFNVLAYWIWDLNILLKFQFPLGFKSKQLKCKKTSEKSYIHSTLKDFYETRGILVWYHDLTIEETRSFKYMHTSQINSCHRQKETEYSECSSTQTNWTDHNLSGNEWTTLSICQSPIFTMNNREECGIPNAMFQGWIMTYKS